jgi:hypothetical protein
MEWKEVEDRDYPENVRGRLRWETEGYVIHYYYELGFYPKGAFMYSFEQVDKERGWSSGELGYRTSLEDAKEAAEKHEREAA